MQESLGSVANNSVRFLIGTVKQKQLKNGTARNCRGRIFVFRGKNKVKHKENNKKRKNEGSVP